MVAMKFVSPNPGLVPTLIHLRAQMLEDKTVGLWAPLSDDNPDRMGPETLEALFSDDFDATAWTRDFFSTTRLAHDFSLLSLYAIQSDQWQRKDLLSLMMRLQHQALMILDDKQRAHA